MPQATWSVQDAKNHFSEVMEAARLGEPQTVTKHGKPTVVVLSADDYARLRLVERGTAPSFAEHLLSMPTDGGEFDRLEGRVRDVGF
jgi:antitoxin Phd